MAAPSSGFQALESQVRRGTWLAAPKMPRSHRCQGAAWNAFQDLSLSDAAAKHTPWTGGDPTCSSYAGSRPTKRRPLRAWDHLSIQLWHQHYRRCGASVMQTRCSEGFPFGNLIPERPRRCTLAIRLLHDDGAVPVTPLAAELDGERFSRVEDNLAPGGYRHPSQHPQLHRLRRQEGLRHRA